MKYVIGRAGGNRERTATGGQEGQGKMVGKRKQTISQVYENDRMKHVALYPDFKIRNKRRKESKSKW